jgi:hypothetical protein
VLSRLDHPARSLAKMMADKLTSLIPKDINHPFEAAYFTHFEVSEQQYSVFVEQLAHNLHRIRMKLYAQLNTGDD